MSFFRNIIRKILDFFRIDDTPEEKYLRDNPGKSVQDGIDDGSFNSTSYNDGIDPDDDSFLGNIWNETGGLNGLMSALTGRILGTNLTGAEREQNAFNAEQAQINRDYQTQMSNTAYQRAVADMRAAGLNPALMYGSGSGASSTPSGSVGSGSHSGSLMDPFSLMLQIRNFKLQERAQSHQILADRRRLRNEQQIAVATVDELNSRAEKNRSEANKTDIETSWIDRLNQSLIDAGNDKHELTSAQIEESDARVKSIVANIEKTIAETRSEEERKLLIDAQRRYQDASTHEKYSLLQANKNLIEAKTGTERAQALLVNTQYLTQQGLLDHGYVNNYIFKQIADIKEQDLRSSLMEFQKALREGKAEEFWRDDADLGDKIVSALAALRLIQ